MHVSSPSDPKTLQGRDYAFLLIIALIVDIVLVAMQPVPGYMDSAYYYATGIQLAEGRGFSEPFAWNYLDDPQTLPHPSHSYWYPLASLVAAAGMVSTGNTDFFSARIGFFLIALLFPLLSAKLAWRFSRKRHLALASGFLAIFCGYYLPFIVTSDNYAIYLLMGALFILLADQISITKAFLLGVLAGGLNLARADGLLWLPLSLVAVTYLAYQKNRTLRQGIGLPWRENLSVMGGYFSIFGFWMARNLAVYGSITAPGASHVLWMTEYNQLFSLTPEMYTFQSWLAQGWKDIIRGWLIAFRTNLGTGLIAQGMVFLSPFILIGIRQKWDYFPVKLACLGWVILLFSESFLFPYASVGGGFFHAGTAFQPAWLALAPVGVEKVADFLLKGRFSKINRAIFQIILIIGVCALSILLVKIRVVDAGWEEGEYRYLAAEEKILNHGAGEEAVVVAVNPPAYNAMTGRSAIVIPDGDIVTLLSAARRFHAEYVIVEKDRSPDLYQTLIENLLEFPEFTDLGGFEDVRIYSISPEK